MQRRDHSVGGYNTVPTPYSATAIIIIIFYTPGSIDTRG